MARRRPRLRNAHTHLQRFVLHIDLQQRVSHQVPEAAAVEIPVRLCVAPAVVDLRELQPAKLQQVVTMEILGLTEHLCTKSPCGPAPRKELRGILSSARLKGRKPPPPPHRIFAGFDTSGLTGGASVEVVACRRLAGDVKRQDEASGKSPARGVVHLETEKRSRDHLGIFPGF